MKRIKKFKIGKILIYLPVILVMIFVLFPFYWTLNTSFKTSLDIMKIPLRYIPDPVTFQNYFDTWNTVGFGMYFRNSLIVALTAVVAIVACSILVGYTLSRFKFRGKNAFMLIMLSTQFIPHVMLLIPLFIILKNIHLLGSLMSLIITYTAMQFPFNSIIMRGFITNIPYEIEEAAMIDGCGRFQCIVRILLPILLPGIVASASFAFIGCWNEFIFALMFINKNSLFTIPVALNSLQGQYDINYGYLAAGCIIAVIPAFLLFAYIQKFLVKGLSAGAVKG